MLFRSSCPQLFSVLLLACTVSEACSITDCSYLHRSLICLLENTFVFLYSCCFMLIFCEVLPCVMYTLSHFQLNISQWYRWDVSVCHELTARMFELLLTEPGGQHPQGEELSKSTIVMDVTTQGEIFCKWWFKKVHCRQQFGVMTLSLK